MKISINFEGRTRLGRLVLIVMSEGGKPSSFDARLVFLPEDYTGSHVLREIYHVGDELHVSDVKVLEVDAIDIEEIKNGNVRSCLGREGSDVVAEAKQANTLDVTNVIGLRGLCAVAKAMKEADGITVDLDTADIELPA